MRDITAKKITLRTAVAIGKVICSSDIVELIKKDALPKGNLFDIAKAAAFLAAKNTSNLIPHCHPVSIDSFQINFRYLDEETADDFLFEDKPTDETGILIYAEAKSIGRTGIEMEVLTGVSIAALTIYDLLKPLGNKDISITDIRLLEKTGGKSDRKKITGAFNNAAILVCSDSTASGNRKDSSGLLIKTMLEEYQCQIADYKVIADDKILIQDVVKEWVKKDIHFIFTTGGTGLGPRDNTADAIKEIIEKDAPGISEAMRSFGQMRTPLAMMSRSFAGSINKTLIITLPGSSNGVKESLQAILPEIFHARKMMLGGGH